MEKTHLIEPLSTKRLQSEYWAMLAHFIKVLLELLTATCFILLDHLVAVGLELVAKYSRIDYVQTGEHIVNITVKKMFFLHNIQLFITNL